MTTRDRIIEILDRTGTYHELAADRILALIEEEPEWEEEHEHTFVEATGKNVKNIEYCSLCGIMRKKNNKLPFEFASMPKKPTIEPLYYPDLQTIEALTNKINEIIAYLTSKENI